jgi:hypothetical protein
MKLSVAMLTLAAFGGVARADLPSPDLLSLLPRNSDCLGQMDVDAFNKWKFAPRVLDAAPKLVEMLRTLGMYPLAGLHRISAAALRTGPQRADGVFIVEAQQANPLWTALGEGRFAAGAQTRIGDVVKRARGQVAARSSLADTLSAMESSTMRGVCMVSMSFREKSRKDWPEVDRAEHIVFNVALDDGAKINAAIVFRDEAAAAASLARMDKELQKFKTGRMAGMFSFKAFAAPVQLSQKGKRLELRYVMPPALVEQALSMAKIMRDLSESSGDPVR